MPIAKYPHQQIESKWQKRWMDERLFAASEHPEQDKRYVLDMFPYPSGDGLHVGHPEGYTATDIYSRFLRMNGVHVLHPMGWDAFGLPAENAAIKKGIHPRAVTTQNIENFKRQIQSIGFSYDWEREVNTTDPAYYRWTQWSFLQLFKRGLAYEQEAPIWWCPKDKTGLANEEVVNGKCDRCGTTVEKRMLKQWMLRITAYADRLLAGLDDLDWPDSIKALQRNWIGKSEGAEVVFTIGEHPVTVFTTRPDTLFGATYLVLSPEHELVKVITTKPQRKAVDTYVKSVAAKSDLERTSLEKEKTGVFTGAFAVNPVNDEKIPVWIADYVLSGYGTGAIMAVPGHDQRDFDFATKYTLPIRYVVAPHLVDPKNPPLPGKPTKARKTVQGIIRDPKTDRYLCLQWKEQPWTTFVVGGVEDGEDLETAVRREIAEETGYEKLRLIKQLGGPIQAEYYAAHKGENRLAMATAFLFELTSQQQGTIAPAERAKHDIVWKPLSEIRVEKMNCVEWSIWSEQLRGDTAYTGDGVLVNSGPYDGQPTEESRKLIVAPLEKSGKGKRTTNYKLRDWVFSRQRYWGEPIPVVHCQHCREVVESTPHHHELSSAHEWRAWLDGEQTITNAALAKEISTDTRHANHYVKVTFGPNVGYWRVRAVKKNSLTLKHVLPGIILVPESELPLELPNVERYEPTGTGESPLAAIDDWVNVSCRICGHPAKRETNTMPQWAGSCWYYLRFCDPKNSEAFASAEALQAWLPVDLYVGGAEHAVLHLLYARFWHMVLYDIGAIPKENDRGESLAEPFRKLKNQGLILGPDGEKMSKSRGNVINPDEIIDRYGADTLRLYEMFMGPFEDAKPWDTNGIVGVRRFLERVWGFAHKVDNDQPTRTSASHKYVAAITKGIETFQFNTCVSDLMSWSNGWKNAPCVPAGDFDVFLKLLFPFAPHLAEEVWQLTDHETLLARETWPSIDPDLVGEDTVTIAVQVNGKLRGTLTMPAGSVQPDVETAAKAEPNVGKFLAGVPKKTIFVQDKLINFVV